MIEPGKLFQLAGGQKRRKLALTFGALERDILGIDSHMRIVGILALGKPEKRNPAHALDELNWDKVHYI